MFSLLWPERWLLTLGFFHLPVRCMGGWHVVDVAAAVSHPPAITSLNCCISYPLLHNKQPSNLVA